ncbi:MAG: SPOR domain-containing protein [Fibrobacter sp.]|nr:SPOR domain-containing protein [Fibrobacter sp.]
MNFIGKHFTLATILLSAICANAQDPAATASQTDAAPTAPQASPAATALANAQKSYVAGNWKEAAAAYSVACPMQPKEKQDECLLWNVLALSQTGDAKSFKEAGKRLDSLIQVVNPQQSLYADLMMTSAQFRLYLGKYDKAAESLIHAIETSQPNQYVVLQKVCQAVKSKYHSDELVERCNMLDNPGAKVQPATVPQAAPLTTTSSTTPQPKTDSVVATSSPAPANTAPAVSSSSVAPVSSAAAPASSATAQATPAQNVSTAPQPQEKPSEEYWVLQLGAFSVKDNANMLVSTLKKNNVTATIVEQPRGEKLLYLVQTGHFQTKEAAVDYGAKRLAPLKVEFQPLSKK